MPADCPVEDYPNLDPAEDSVAKLGNPIIPREVAMEHFLRRWTTDLMNRIAQKEGWEVAEINESGSSGYRDLPPHDTPLNYALRPPHWFGITYQFIINKDSLAAWHDWLVDLANRRLTDMNQYTSRMASVEDESKAYMDSANYYGNLKTKYMTDHMQSYQQALMSGNKLGTGAYEKALEAYDKKINYWINKATDLQKDPASEKTQADAEDEKKVRGLAWRDATVVTMEMRFNADFAETNEARAVGGSGTGGGGATSGYTMVRWFNNPEPYLLDPINLFARSKNFVLVLAGPWNLRPDQHGLYYPAFRADKQARDETTPKRFKSDQIQTITIHIAGNRAASGRVLADLPAGQLNGMIVKGQ